MFTYFHVEKKQEKAGDRIFDIENTICCSITY